MKIKSESDALVAMNKFHEQGVKTVIFSSTELGQQEGQQQQFLLALASTRGPGAGDSKVVGNPGGNAKGIKIILKTFLPPPQAFKILIPKFPAAFVGTGDLFTALTTAWLTKTDNDLALTLERTIATMQARTEREMPAESFN